MPTGAIEQYTYDQYHNVRTALTEEGLEALFLYDEYPDNKYVTFVYEAGSLLSLVKGIDTTDLDYTYNTTISGLPNRINSVKLINRSTNVTNGTLKRILS